MKESKENKLTKNALSFYNELIDIYKKEYNQAFESKDDDWRLKHDYNNLKDNQTNHNSLINRSNQIN